MITIFELLSKIKWDEKENADEYIIAYYDRIKDRNIEIPLTEVVNIDKLTLVIRKSHEDVEIPLHRVRKVYKKGLLLWSREN